MGIHRFGRLVRTIPTIPAAVFDRVCSVRESTRLLINQRLDLQEPAIRPYQRPEVAGAGLSGMYLSERSQGEAALRLPLQRCCLLSLRIFAHRPLSITD